MAQGATVNAVSEDVCAAGIGPEASAPCSTYITHWLFQEACMQARLEVCQQMRHVRSLAQCEAPSVLCRLTTRGHAAGIGPEASALCSTYITECASLVKDFIYLGTSGWSAQQGGILNAPGPCTSANGLTPRTRECA